MGQHEAHDGPDDGPHDGPHDGLYDGPHDGPDAGLRDTGWWREDDARHGVVLLRAAGIAVVLVVGVLLGVAGNWDVALVAAALAAAGGVDLWRDLRPRQVVVASDEALLVRVRETSTTPWERISHVTLLRRWPFSERPVLVLRDGSRVPLPAGLPVERVRRWVAQRRDG